MDKDLYNTLHNEWGLCDLDLTDLLYYIAERATQELKDVRTDPFYNVQVAMLLESVVDSCESAAFEYYASAK